MFQALIKNRGWWILISMILGYITILSVVWNDMSILEYLDFSQIEQIDYWNNVRSHLNIINGIGALMIFATSSAILAFLLFTLTYYLRLYQNDLRIIFQEVFGFLSLIPCIFWCFMFFLAFQPNSNLNPLGNLAMLLLLNSVMIFPMLLNALFKAINSMSDGYIQTGYALGANSSEIAFLLVAPKLIKPISAAIVLIFTRLMIELAILAVVIGIWSMSTIALSIILLIAISSILVFLLKRS